MAFFLLAFTMWSAALLLLSFSFPPMARLFATGLRCSNFEAPDLCLVGARCLNSQLLNRISAVEGSDTRDADSSNAADYINKTLVFGVLRSGRSPVIDLCH